MDSPKDFTRYGARAVGVACVALAVVVTMRPVSHAVPADDGLADTVFTMPEIVVEAKRPVRDDVHRRSGFVTVVNLGARRDRVEDLAGVLAQSAGVHIRQYGGLGSFATVSIRGSSASQVDVYLDGMPLGDAYLGVTNLADLPLDGIERIEVYRGFSPPQLGASAIGGAVNLVTTDDAKWNRTGWLARVEGRESFGGFGTSRHALSVWSRAAAVKVFLHGGYVESEGDFEFSDDRTTPENPADDARVKRRNNDFDSWNTLGRIEAPVPGVGRVALSHNALWRDQGVPGVGSFQSRTARSQRSQQRSYLQFQVRPLLGTSVQLFADAFHSATREHFRDPEGDIALVPQDTDNTFRDYGGSARARIRLPLLPVRIELFHRTDRERYRPVRHLPARTEGPDRTRLSQTSAVSGDLFLQRFGLVLTAGRRFERETTAFYDPPHFPWLPPTPQGKVRRRDGSPHYGFRWLPKRFLTIKGNWGTYFRRPTMLELFGNQGSVTGRADLEPEVGTNRDLGVVVSFAQVGRLHDVMIETVYLDNTVERLIVFFPNSQFTSRPENIDSARIRGWEASVASTFSRRLRVAGNYTRLESRNTGPIPFYNGNDLPGRPENETAVFVDYTVPRWKLSWEYHHIGRNFLDPANMRPVSAREIHNVALRVGPSAGVALTLEGRNVTNNQIRDVSGFPLPGRSVFLTLDVQR